MYRTSYRSIPTSRGPSYLPTSNQRSILPTSTARPSTGNCFLGIHETGKFKELYKIEEEVIRERATGKFKEHIKLRKRLEYRGRTVVGLGQVWDRI
jgi:hypothetical protein